MLLLEEQYEFMGFGWFGFFDEFFGFLIFFLK